MNSKWNLIKHLEGGEEPYNLRMKKYNLGQTH